MYTPNNLYKNYKERILDTEFSKDLPDVTCKSTLTHMNSSINLCKHWNAAMDIGCGTGHYLGALATKFNAVIGIEVDPNEYQKKLVARSANIQIHNVMIEDFDAKEKMDFILLMDIFEHIKDINAFMAQIASIQDKNGIVNIITPNPLFCGPAEASEIFWKKVGYHGHQDHYTKKEIIEICMNAGYDLEFCVYEETVFRDKMRIIVKGISRRYHRLPRIFQAVVIWPLKLVFKIIESLCFRTEMKHQNDKFNTRSICLTFKKA